MFVLCIKRITNKDLVNSARNVTQYSVMAYMENESKKTAGSCLCITDALCYTPETNTIL